MDMSSSNRSMTVVFNTATDTPLFSESWTPNSSGTYAGTCIFLVILAIALRLLFASKAVLERRWATAARNRRYVVVQGQRPVSERINSLDDAKYGSLVTAQGVEERVKYVQADGRSALPFRLSVDLPRAALVTVIAGIAYLLMLAVMTVNVGYFMSILAGVFVGELAVGRYEALDEH